MLDWLVRDARVCENEDEGMTWATIALVRRLRLGTEVGKEERGVGEGPSVREEEKVLECDKMAEGCLAGGATGKRGSEGLTTRLIIRD